MKKTEDKCSLCGRNLLKDCFNGRVDIACPEYFFGPVETFNLHDHSTKIAGGV